MSIKIIILVFAIIVNGYLIVKLSKRIKMLESGKVAVYELRVDSMEINYMVDKTGDVKFGTIKLYTKER